MLAISGDDLEDMKEFKASLAADFPFIPDPDGELLELYDVKVPIFTIASRTTFVIDERRSIVSVTSGGDALDPSAAVEAAGQACGP